MPLKIVKPEDQAKAWENMEPEFCTMLEDSLVPVEAICLMGHLRCKRLRTFAKIARNEDGVRKWLLGSESHRRMGCLLRSREGMAGS